MKKTKSASLLKIPSLTSTSKKGELDQQSLTNRLTVARSSANLLTLIKPRQLAYFSQAETQTTAESCQPQSNSNNHQASKILRNKLTTLHQEIQKLEQEIAEAKDSQSSRTKGKDYDNELKRYQEVGASVRVCQTDLTKNKQILSQIKNIIKMTQQDILSMRYRLEQRLAQKQYCQQIIEQYKREFQSQNPISLSLFTKQQQNMDLGNKIVELEKQLNERQRALEDWKQQIQFDLQQKIVKNKLIQLRMELMKAQQSANAYADSHKLMKLRQILCVFIKSKAQQNKKSSNYMPMVIGDQGMEVYTCMTGNIEEYHQAVLQYRGQHKQKYEPSQIQKYFDILAKIEAIISNRKLKLNREINQQHMNQIAKIRLQLINSEQAIKINKELIKKLNDQLQIVFANESVAIIQHLHQTMGHYPLNQIKSTLKTLKTEQRTRVNKIKQIFINLHKINKNDCEQLCISKQQLTHMNNLLQLKSKQQKMQSQVKALQMNERNLLQIKENIQNQISMAVSKWGQLSLKKEQLKLKYKQLSKLNKEIRQAENEIIHKKQSKFASKEPLMNIMSTLKAHYTAKSMRETLKLRICGQSKYKNKENQPKLLNQSKIKFGSTELSSTMENCRTRKPSLSSRVTSGKSARDQLTAVLYSKLVL